MPTRRKTRRITAADNSTTVPNRTTFPQGTYYQPPLSNPSTASNGNLGQPYSMLPSSPKPNNPFAPIRQTYAPLSAPSGGIPNLNPGSTSPNQYLIPPAGGTFASAPPVFKPVPNSGTSFSGWNAQNAAAMNTALKNGTSVYQQSERNLTPTTGIGTTPVSTGSFSPQAAEYYVMQRIANGQSVSPAEIEAATKLLTEQGLVPQTQTTTEAGTGQTINSTEFTSTGFYQKYQEQGTSFENQLRWDPERKKYVKIGRLINEGRLDVRDRRAKLKRSKRGRQIRYEQSAAAPAEQASTALPGAFGVVNFNTAEG